MKSIKYIVFTLIIGIIPALTGCSDGRNGDNLTNNLGRAADGYGRYNDGSLYSNYLDNNNDIGYNLDGRNGNSENRGYGNGNSGYGNGGYGNSGTQYGNSTGMTTEYNGAMPFND